MVHLRARNLPSKGILKKWLFSGEEIIFGQDFASIELEDGREVSVKSNYNGMVVKTITLGSSIKNGSILANIAIGEKEIQKFKNRNLKKPEVENIQHEETILVKKDEDLKMQSVESDADSFSGAVLYDRYNQARTPYSSGREDIKDSAEKIKQLEEKDQSMGQSTDQPKDRFAQMRANIRESIKNAPQNKLVGDLSKDELLKMTNESVAATEGGNLFSADNVTGVSKFRQLVQARKEKLLEENDFKEVMEANEDINAMSKLDEKGRPLIMRNIIQSRIEKLNNSGGDPSVLERDIVATKDNAILGRQKPQIQMSEIEKTQEGERMKMKNLEVKSDSKFMRQGASVDGDFGVNYGSYIDDEEETIIDSNDLNPYGGLVLPRKKPNDLIREIENKSQKTYAEAKLSNLYDTSRRWNIMKNQDERGIINERRRAVESGLNEDNFEFSKKIRNFDIPKEFLRDVPRRDSKTGKMTYIPYNQTVEGKREFENWLRVTNLYSAYKNEQKYIEKTQELEQNAAVNNEFEKFKPDKVEQVLEAPEKTSKVVQKEIKTEINKQDTEFVKASDKKIADETVEFLKDQIKDLQKTLKEQNQLNAATSKLNQQSNFNAGTDTFGQMMQYMLMQNMMQNMNQNKESNKNFSANDFKVIIKEEINAFANELQEKKRQEEEKERYEQEVTERIEKALREKYKLERLELEKENIREVNFERDRPDNSVGYLQFESNDENKLVEREKMNKNRNSAVKSMILSQNFIPPLTISTEIDMSSILKLKHMLKQTQNHIKFTTISFIAKSISIALEEHPKLNSSYDPETNEVIIKKYHNIGLATETSEGLIIPVLKFVDRLSVKEVAIDIKEVTSRLRSGELYNYEADGSTITIANYGNIGAIQATPTIFYPNAAVIGVGKVVKKPVVVDNEKLAIKAIMNMSLTVDQRIIDAAEAGKFLAKVKAILEKPEILTVS